MIYRSMRKLYYEYKANTSKLNRAYEERMRGDSTSVLKLKINDNPAFFVYTPEIMELILELQLKNFELFKKRSQLPKVALSQYTKNCLIEEVGLTNEMENVHSTRREIEDSLDAVENARLGALDMRFLGMVEKYNRLIHAETVMLESCQDIRDLYDQLVLPEVVREDPNNAPDGEIFRKGIVYVGDKHGGTVHEGVYPESAIISGMNEALNFLNNASYNIWIRIAVFHYMFGYIHPFYDGNGRMSRFISSYLISQELDSSVALRLSSVIKNEKAKYDRMFREANEVHNRGDLTDFIFEFLTFVKKTIEDVYGFLSERKMVLDKFARLLSTHRKIPTRKSALWILIQNALFAETGMGIAELVKETQMSRTTVDKELSVYLNEWRVLDISKIGHKNIYRLNLDKLLEYLSLNLIGGGSSQKEEPF